MGGSSSGGSNKTASFGDVSLDFNQMIPPWQQAALSSLYGNSAALDKTVDSRLWSQIPNLQNTLRNAATWGTPALQNLLRGGSFTGIANTGPNSTLGQFLYGGQQTLNAQDIRNTIDAGNRNLNNYLGSQNRRLDSLLSQNLESMAPRIYANIMGGEGNNYADAMKDQFVADANRSYENMMSNLDARAEAAGMSGSSRHGVAQGIGARGINDALQANIAKVGYDTFDKDLQNKMMVAQMADANQFGLQQAKLGALQGNIASGVNALQGNLSNNLAQLAPGASATGQFGANAILQGMQAKDNTALAGLNSIGTQQSNFMGSMSPLFLPWQGQQMYGSMIRDPNVLSNLNSDANWYLKQKGSTSSKGGGIK